MAEVAWRGTLHAQLREAAVVEQQLALQYLYAAASLQWRPPPAASPAQQLAHERARGAAMTLMLLARQEMEHQGWVANLLVATGAEPPAFDAPSLPHRLPFGGPARLQAFGREALVRFIAYERPDDLDAPTAPCTMPEDLQAALVEFEAAHPGSGGSHHAAILHHYTGLYRTLIEVAAADPPLVRREPRGGQVVQERYDVALERVTSLTDALAAVDQVVLEGEGGSAASLWWSLPDRLRRLAVALGVPVDGPPPPTTTTPDRSHFCRLVGLWPLVSDPALTVPVLDVPTDPSLDGEPGAPGRITHPYTRAITEVAEGVHGVVLDGLRVSWAARSLPDLDALALSEVAFFQSMTMCVRPLLMVLARLPRTEDVDDPRRGGMTFRATGRYEGPFTDPLVPARTSLVTRLEALADRLAGVAEAGPPPGTTDPDLVRALLVGLQADLARIGANLAVDSTAPLGAGT